MNEIVHVLDQDTGKMVDDSVVNEYIKDKFGIQSLSVIDYLFLILQIAAPLNQ